MTLSNHVSISISLDSVSVPRANFGTGMLISHSADWVERTRSYGSLAGVATDFPITTSPEYLGAQAYFSQSPRPDELKIGRAALVPTKKVTLVPVVANATAYVFTAGGEGVTTEEVSYTSDADATLAEICAGILAALNAVTGKNFTATGGVTEVVVTGDTAGDWFFVEVDDVGLCSSTEDHADPGIATDLAAIAAADNEWYALLTNFNSEAYVKAAAAWAASNKKLYVFDTNDTDSLAASDGATGTLDDLMTLSYARTAGSYHPRPNEMLSAAWCGRMLPKNPGSATWKFKSLSGVGRDVLTGTRRANLRARNANFYEEVATVAFMSEGMTSDGDFIDTQRGLDWLEDDISKTVFENMVGPDKVPFTDAGVTSIVAAVKASLKRGVKRGVLSADPAPTVTAPLVKNVSTANKTARTLPDVVFGGTLAGAIHKANLTGVVSA